jgi:hypothetical protein
MPKIYRNQVMMSTSLDQHGERFTEEELRACFEQMVPEELMTAHHDPSLPLFAKSLNKRLEQHKDGEWAILADIEVYDEERLKEFGGYSVTVKCGGRRFVEKDPAIEIMFNPRIVDTESMLSLCAYFATEDIPIDAIYLKQKSAELPLMIGVGFTFVAGSIAVGFLREIGKDIYAQLKKRLANACREAEKKDGQGRICECRITFHIERDKGHIDIYTSVTADDLDWMVDHGLSVEEIERQIGELARIEDVKKATLKLDRGRAVWEVVMVIMQDDQVVVRQQ